MPTNPSPEKQRHVSLFIALVSVVLGFCLHQGGEKFCEIFKTVFNCEFPSWLGGLIEIASPMFIFAVLSELFEHCLWKMSLIRKLVRSNAPDIGGAWKAEFRSSHDNFETPHSADVFISQSWSTISVSLKADKSHSSSEVAAIISDGSGEAWLVYEYLNEPWPSAVNTMHAHRGTCRLAIKDKTIEGDYYTGRDRNTNGTLTFTRSTM